MIIGNKFINLTIEKYDNQITFGISFIWHNYGKTGNYHFHILFEGFGGFIEITFGE